MTDSSKSWMMFAEKDLLAAEALLSNKELCNIVLFHCQQCVEKCFKAILENNKIDIPRIHSVVKLHNNLKNKLNLGNLASDEELELIDDIYVDTRYPGSFGILPSGLPTIKEAKEVLKIAEKIQEQTLKILGL